jgi:hypothetical protein
MFGRLFGMHVEPPKIVALVQFQSKPSQIIGMTTTTIMWHIYKRDLKLKHSPLRSDGFQDYGTLREENAIGNLSSRPFNLDVCSL